MKIHILQRIHALTTKTVKPHLTVSVKYLVSLDRKFKTTGSCTSSSRFLKLKSDKQKLSSEQWCGTFPTSVSYRTCGYNVLLLSLT